MLVGQFNKFELWDEQVWYKQIETDIGEANLTGTDTTIDLSL